MKCGWIRRGKEILFHDLNEFACIPGNGGDLYGVYRYLFTFALQSDILNTSDPSDVVRKFS